MMDLDGATIILSDDEMENMLAFHDFWLDYIQTLSEEAEIERRYESDQAKADMEARDRNVYAYHGVSRGEF